MKVHVLSTATFFLLASSTALFAQVETDTIKKEQKIDGVVIQGSTNRKTETAILSEQKKSVVQKQSVGTEEISRKGISNVEQGLLKVTGITSVEGRGVFVRGLEERYTYLLINGLGSPSNNPFQKIIALKQFPTDVVGKLNIYKTFNSNLFGDFAGATFDVETLTLEKPFSKVEFGIGFNTQTTFRNHFKMSEGASGMKGYVGLNSRNRQLPDQIKGVRPVNYMFNSSESATAFRDSWNVDDVKALPNTSIGFTTAQKVKTGENSNMSVLFSLNQSSEYQYREGQKNQFKNFGNEIQHNNLLRRKQYNYETESSVLLGLGYKNNKGTNVNFNSIFLQNSNNIIEDYVGFKNNQFQYKKILRTNQQDISRFLDLQLTAAQKIGDRHNVKAGVSYVLNKYQQPDRKIMEGSPEDAMGNPLPANQMLMSYGGNNIIRQYLDVNSKFYGSAYGEYSVYLGEKGERKDYPFQIAIGYNGFADLRNNSYRFIFGKPGAGAIGAPFLINMDQPETVFQQDIKSGKFRYQEESDAYLPFSSIYQFVNGGYANINYKPTDNWDILVGGRYENDMSVIRYNNQGDAVRRTISKNKNLFLPSLSVKNALNNRNNIRLSLSKTITRPVLIETMPLVYINPDNESIVGNPFISSSDNYNADLKWEYFPTNKELFAVNVFAKRIDNPIERSFVTSSDANGVTVTFFNAKRAVIGGVELEGIIGLNRISEALSNFTFGANATFLYSDVTRSDEQLKLEQPEGLALKDLKKRGLQGATPFTINADLKYETKNRQNLKRTVSLVYNVTGSKIYAVGSAGTDNYYERPYSQLDLIYQEQFNKNWNLKLGAQNILNQRYQIQLGENSYIPVNINNNYQYTDYFRGINFNMTVGYTF